MPEHLEHEAARQLQAELLAHRRFLDGDPVVELQLDSLRVIEERGCANESLASRIAAFYKAGGNAEVFVSDIGLVRLDLRAVRNSQWHGNQPERLAAFVAVPEILKKGRIIDASPMRDEPAGQFFQIAAPIRISGEEFIAVAQVKSPPPPKGLIRLYVHQVFSKEKLRQPSDLRATAAGKPTKQTSGKEGAGAAETLLRHIYAVKEA